ncbi:hypothetical protein R9C00_25760 [Flammeovirgaceae bacterium SG7u.111]|nr:hypothetical protein [Flammeovirgaceae bacterium SG7u.132]WPO35104.1 hypothetical protein R9C00_25760 [Flammeovirgaceae bacterium SG7u.111]
MLKLCKLSILLFPLLLGWGCSSDSEEVILPNNRFTKVYDNYDFSSSFYPLDLKQTADGGFLILAQTEVDISDFGGVYVMKTDDEGNFVWEVPASGFVAPTSNLMEINGSFYFMCMDPSASGSYLMKVDEVGQGLQVAGTYGSISYPLSTIATPEGGVGVLGFNRDGQSSTFSKLKSDFSEDWTQSFQILDDPDEAIFNHLTNPNKRLPFFVGNLNGGGFYVNGFYNYTLSVMFLDVEGQWTGVMNGFRDDGAVSAMNHITGDDFAVSRFTFGKNYVHPRIAIDKAGVSSSEDLEGNEYPELQPNANVRIHSMTYESQNLTIYAMDSKSNQIVLYSYDEDTGELLGNKYLGFSEGYKIAGLVETADKGMAIAALTYVTGRFPRISLFKISEGDVKKLIGK